MSRNLIRRVKKAAVFVWKWFRRAVMSIVVALMLIGVVVLIFPNSTLRWAANIWSTAAAPPGKPADAILVLGGGSAFRPQAAAELWKSGRAPKIYVFDPESDFRSEEGNETMNILLEELSVPAEAMELISPQVTSTFDEAEVTAKLVEDRGWTSIIVPTHLFHTRRVEWIFSKHLPDSCKLHVTEAPFRHFRAEDWWKNEWGFLQFPNEVAKMVYYRLRY